MILRSLWIYCSYLEQLLGSQQTSKKAVSFPSSAVKMTKYSCRNPCHAKSLSFHVNTWGPLSPHKLTKAQAMSIVERVADRLPSWKADLLTKAGRVILVQYVLTSMLIYILLALELPPSVLKAIDKIRRAFLWKGRKDVKGGHCLLAWPKVTSQFF